MADIVVGIDGSEHADRALAWAWQEAASRNVGLTLVNAWESPWVGSANSIISVDDATLEGAAKAEEQVLIDAVERLGKDSEAEVQVRMVERRGAVVPTIIDEARDSLMIVAGRRGLGRLGRLVMGSVSAGIVRQSPKPVTIIPAGWQGPTVPKGEAARIVVGVDGSPASLVALQHAFEVAHRTGERIEAVACWQIMSIGSLPGERGWAPPIEDYQSHISKMLDDALVEVGASEGELAEGQVGRVVLHAQAASGLLLYAEGASRLIVGHRGLGGFDRLLLGSVSSQLLEHSPCPVTVLRD